jgi:hypothetical protein
MPIKRDKKEYALLILTYIIGTIIIIDRLTFG